MDLKIIMLKGTRQKTTWRCVCDLMKGEMTEKGQG